MKVCTLKDTIFDSMKVLCALFRTCTVLICCCCSGYRSPGLWPPMVQGALSLGPRLELVLAPL